MEHNVDHIRTLVGRWLASETTLAEEQTLRDYFDGVHPDVLPGDLRAYPHLFGQSVQAAGERSCRKLILHTEPASETPETAKTTIRRPLFRRISAMTAAAAATAAAVMMVFISPEQPQGSDTVCVVNGVRITDPQEIAAYTRESLDIANDNLRKPGLILSSELSSDPALERVGEMLNELTKKAQ